MFEFLAKIIFSYMFKNRMDWILAPTLSKKLNRKIKQWTEKLPQDIRDDFSNMQDKFRFDLLVDNPNGIPTDSTIETICAKLKLCQIPAKEEWKSAFYGQWELMRAQHSSPEQRNSFLNLTDQQASGYFDTLAATILSVYQTQKEYKTDWEKIRQKLQEHSDPILQITKTEIAGIHIERNFNDEIKKLFTETQILLVTGKRGSGKSAAVKEFLESQGNQFFYFFMRAEEFSVLNLEMLFSNMGINLSFNDLLQGLSVNIDVFVIIESLERVLELESQNAFNDFLTSVKKQTNWKVLATCRDYAFDCVQQSFLLKGTPCKTIDIPEFSDEQLEVLFTQCSALSSYKNSPDTVKELLRNPYIAHATTTFSRKNNHTINSLAELKQAVWATWIFNELSGKSGMPQKRGETFKQIAVSRAKSQNYYVDAAKFDPDVLSALEVDGVIYRSKAKSGIAPTHDILEDWAVEHFIESRYELCNNDYHEFYNAVGSERGILRCFRFWLSENITAKVGEMTMFLNNSLQSDYLSKTWKDEILVVILHSNHVAELLRSISDRLLADNLSMLSRLCLILNAACRKYDDRFIRNKVRNTQDFIKFYPFLVKPIANAWKDVIEFLFNHKKAFDGSAYWNTELYGRVVAVFQNYVENPVGDNNDAVLQKIAFFAIEQIQLAINEHEKSYLECIENRHLESLTEIAITLCQYIENEIETFANHYIFSQDDSSNEIVGQFLQKSLMDFNRKRYFCAALPELTVRLLRHSLILPQEDEGYYSYRNDVSDDFGVRDKFMNNALSFGSASAIKGPFLDLLQTHTKIALDVILELLNDSAERYFHSNLDNGKSVVSITLNNGRTIEQYCSQRLYFAYREMMSPYAPAVIQTALMALERYLVDLLRQDDSTAKDVEKIVEYILLKSNSVMPTAVLISLAIGFPEKFQRAVLPFFRVKDFFQLDIYRVATDGRDYHNLLWGMLNRDPHKKIYSKERQEAKNYPWRKKDLREQMMLLQIPQNSIREAIWQILDKHKEELQKEDETNGWANCIHKMDLRNAEIRSDEENDQVLILPTERPDAVETEETKECREFLENQNRMMIILKWGEGSLQTDSIELPAGFSSVEEVVNELRSLEEIMQQSPNAVFFFPKAIILGCSVLLKNFRKELDESSQKWCFDKIFSAIRNVACRRETDKTDMLGVLAATELLPSFFNLGDQADREYLKQIIASLLVYQNDNIRLAVGKAIRNYIRTIDVEFAEQCLYGAIRYAELAKDFYKRFPPSEDVQEKFAKQCEQICSDILTGSLIQPPKRTLTGEDSWFLLPIVNIIPYKNRSAFHSSILDEATSLLIKYHRNERREEDDRFSSDYTVTLPQLLSDYCFHTEELITDISFVKLLLDNIPDSLQIIEGIPIYLLSVSEKSGCIDKFWESWDLIARYFTPIIQQWANGQPNNRNNKNDANNFISNLLQTSFWNDNEHAMQQLHSLLESHKKEFTEFIGQVIVHPTVFSSFTKLFFTFPDIFESNGLTILVKNFESENPKYDYFSNETVRYYVEVIIYRLQQSIINFTNEDIDNMLKILDIIIDKGSPCAFLLRESLFTRKKRSDAKSSTLNQDYIF